MFFVVHLWSQDLATHGSLNLIGLLNESMEISKAQKNSNIIIFDLNFQYVMWYQTWLCRHSHFAQSMTVYLHRYHNIIHDSSVYIRFVFKQIVVWKHRLYI